MTWLERCAYLGGVRAEGGTSAIPTAEVKVPPGIAARATLPIERMVQIG